MASKPSQTCPNTRAMSTAARKPKRFRSSTACTACRQMKLKCDRRERLPNRCSRCENTNSTCEIRMDFERKRMKGSAVADEETRRLKQEVELLKAQLAGNASPISHTASIGPTPKLGEPGSGLPINVVVAEGARPLDPLAGLVATDTLQRSVDGLIVFPWQIDLAFSTFYRDIHPFLPFLGDALPNAFYDREPFLFWVICCLGFRSTLPELSKKLVSHVTMDALLAPQRTCHKQAAATSVVQGLLLLSIWPMRTPSLLHETAWLHCGAATHLALHIGLHQPYAAEEFVPQNGRGHIPDFYEEFKRTWIAVYVVNCLISFVRGYPCTVRADHNIIAYTQSAPSQLGANPELLKLLLLARRIEEGEELGRSRTGEYGHVEPGGREGIYKILNERLADMEKKISPASPYLATLSMAVQLQPAIQVLQSTSPIPLQETTVLAAVNAAAQVISLGRMVQSKSATVHLPVFLDSLVMMATVLLFKITISRFSSLVNVESAQQKIAAACSYFRDGTNEFNDIPARVSVFVEALYSLVMENHLPVGGFVIENTKCRGSQNILYEVLWIFKEWKRQRLEMANPQQAHQTLTANINNSPGPPADPFAFLDDDQLDPGFWQMFGYEGGIGI